LIGLYAEKTRSVVSFVDVKGFPFVMTQRGAVVGVFPIDHLAWTAGFDQRETDISSAIKQIPGVTGKELLITGTVDPVARKALEDRGWTVRDKYEDQILFKMGY
jgi:hypothetical protein